MLRDYQIDMKKRILDVWNNGLKSVMVQMPTGTGKTHLLASVVGDFIVRNEGAVWIIAHRRELVCQIENTLEKYAIKHNSGVKVLSIQWLTRHCEEQTDKPDLIIIDEAHHALADSYVELWKRFPNAKKLGMTATPCRLNSRGFSSLFDSLVSSWSIAEFISKGVLSPYDYVSIKPNSREQRLIDSLEKRGADGDFQTKEMNEVLNRSASIEYLFDSIERFAPGKKGIVYTICIEHARNIANLYCSKGLKSVAIDSKTPATERIRNVELFKKGEIDVLVNVDVFSEGFDCPDVEFIQLARPTLSLSKYLQQVGRGLRKATGKDSCMLIDNVGLHRLFGLPSAERNWEAMFKGVISGKGYIASHCCKNEFLAVHQNKQEDNDMEVVVTHEQLLWDIEQGTNVQAPSHIPSLKGFEDETNGLWGLKRGRAITAEPTFLNVFDIEGDRAVVRLKNCQIGVVDSYGNTIRSLGYGRNASFMKDDILHIVDDRNKESYIDLRNGQRFDDRPEIIRFEGAELIKAGWRYYSRTKRTYCNTSGQQKDLLIWNEFYLELHDCNEPATCRRVYPKNDFRHCSSACIIKNEEDEVFWMSGKLTDGSIVVMDHAGRYFHVTKEHGKRIVFNNDGTQSADQLANILESLRKDAEERVRSKKEKDERMEEELRAKRMSKIDHAVPFQMGLRWGLKSGERIVVPPKFRKILSPVGHYCAYEENARQWGVMAIDGRIIIKARYMDVDIEQDGTVHLTLIPGKVETVKL